MYKMDDIIADFKRFSTPLVGVRIRAEPDVKVHKVKIAPKKISKEKPAERSNASEKQHVHKKQPVSEKTTVENPESNITLEEIAAKALPLQAVRTNGVINNVNSGIILTCSRGHKHHYSLLDIIAKSPLCKSCSVPGAITRRIRAQMEDIFAVPFHIKEQQKTHNHYEAELCDNASGSKNIHLFTVKSGHAIDTPQNDICIILPESQSKLLINESIYKQCASLKLPHNIHLRIESLVPKKAEKNDNRIPYSNDFAKSKLHYKTINSTKLYIENCGWNSAN